MKQVAQSIFKAYDIRGVYPAEFNEEAAYRIAQAYVAVVRPHAPVVLGRDVRVSSPALWNAAADGLLDAGVDVIDIGAVSTDMLFFAVAHYGFGGGITITASHNPKQYNGMKMVRAGAVAISADTGIADIKRVVMDGTPHNAARRGKLLGKSILDEYCTYVRTFANLRHLKKFKIVANANNGMSGVVLSRLVERLPLEIIPMNFIPDGTFPGGSPDPMYAPSRAAMKRMIKKNHAHFGVAWDADADRCIFFDSSGEVVHGYYTAAIIAEIMLKKFPKERILHDPRLTWAITDTVRAAGGVPVETKVGSSFIKNRMHDEGFLFAGEASGHYYFRDYFCADNGMIPFLLMLEHLSVGTKTLKQIADSYRKKYPIIDEQNFTVTNAPALLKRLEAEFAGETISHVDGVSIETDRWRCNLRASNTEPLIRFNAEAKTPRELRALVKRVNAILKP